MVNPKGNISSILLFKQGKAIKKANYLAKKRKKKKTVKPYDWLTDKEIDDYIKSLKAKLIDDPKVASVLLKYQELKKKYSEVSANKTAELDMKKFIKNGKK